MKKGRHLLATAVAAVIASITTTTSASRYEIPLPFSKIQNFYHFSSITLSSQTTLHSSFVSNSATPGNFFSSPGLTSVSGNTPLSFNDGQFLTASGGNLSNTDVAQILYGTDLNTATINSAGSAGLFVGSVVIRKNLSGNSSISNGTANFDGAGAISTLSGQGIFNGTSTLSVGTLNLIGAGTTNNFTSVGIIKIGSGGVIITGNNSSVPEPTTLALFGAIGTAIVTKRPKRRVS